MSSNALRSRITGTLESLLVVRPIWRPNDACPCLPSHRCQYADRDPLQNIDPTGKFSVAIALGTIAIMGGNMAKAHHDVQQGDRIVGIHLANIIMQSTVLNFIFTVIEEPLLSPHMVKAWVYWQRQLQPVLYKNASKLNLTPRRLQIAVRVMAGVYSDAARAQELGIPMKLNGFPNFSKLLYKRLPIIKMRDSVVFRRLTGSRSSDFTATNNIMRGKFPGMYTGQPTMYTWHHHEVVGIHMLVARGIGGKKLGSIITTIGHELLRHGGGVMYWSLINNKKYS